MAEVAPIREDQSLDEIQRHWPATVHVLIAARMACVGCPVAPFHTVVDAAREYGWPVADLLAALQRAASVAGDADEGMWVTHDDPPAPAVEDT